MEKIELNILRVLHTECIKRSLLRMSYTSIVGAGLVQAVQCLTTGWTTG
jgi:hypothetical protein